MCVAVASLADGSQRVGFINKQDAAQSLVAEAVDDLRRLALIRTDHLGTVNLDHMSAVQIADGCQYLAQLAGYRCLARSWVTRQDDVHRQLFLFAQASFSPLQTVLHRVSYLTYGLLHSVHADEVVQVVQYLVKCPFFRYISLDVVLLNLGRVCSPADEGGEDVFGRLHGEMSIAEGFVLHLDLVLEEACQLLVSLGAVVGDAVLLLQLHLGDVAQLLTVGRGQAERVLEPVLHSRVALQEIVKSLGKSRHDDDGVVVPLVHLHKELVERIHLIGILVGQQLLYVVKEQDAILCLLDVVVPFVDEAAVVHRIHHRQLGLLDDSVLIEVVANDFGQSCLTCAGLTNDNGIDRKTYLGNVLSRV